MRRKITRLMDKLMHSCATISQGILQNFYLQQLSQFIVGKNAIKNNMMIVGKLFFSFKLDEGLADLEKVKAQYPLMHQNYHLMRSLCEVIMHEFFALHVAQIYLKKHDILPALSSLVSKHFEWFEQQYAGMGHNYSK